MGLSVYQTRRKGLAKQLVPHSIAIIPAAQEVVRNGDAEYRFRQHSDFLYLTGFNEPNALLCVTSEGESILFNRSRDPLHEQWTGARLGQEQAVEALGITVAYSIDEVMTKLPELLSERIAIYMSMGQQPQWDKRIIQAWQIVKGQVRRGVEAAQAFWDLAPLLGEMRLIKDTVEINLMRQAASITVAGHKRAMRAASKASFEYELEAELLYAFTRAGCRNVAYDSIVASGANACTLHYTANNAALDDGALILIDAGAEYNHYAADVTRTFPRSGRFNNEQRLIYELVLRAQQAAMALVKPGIAWNELQTTIVQILTYGLVELGVLQGEPVDLIQREVYRCVYMHNSGHWLGLDVHDVGQYKYAGQWRALEPNMVLTIEPGIYIKPGLTDINPRWWGIGVRIEDDVLVTSTGHDNLTAALPVEVDAIEALVRG